METEGATILMWQSFCRISKFTISSPHSLQKIIHTPCIPYISVKQMVCLCHKDQNSSGTISPVPEGTHIYIYIYIYIYVNLQSVYFWRKRPSTRTYALGDCGRLNLYRCTSGDWPYLLFVWTYTSVLWVSRFVLHESELLLLWCLRISELKLWSLSLIPDIANKVYPHPHRCGHTVVAASAAPPAPDTPKV